MPYYAYGYSMVYAGRFAVKQNYGKNLVHSFR